jgi:hypothetical protein
LVARAVDRYRENVVLLVVGRFAGVGDGVDATL